MKDNEWNLFVKRIWHPEFDYILNKIQELFDKEKKGIENRKEKKNLVLLRIYLPKKDFKLLEKYQPFKKLHSLGGIPVIESKKKNIEIETEVIDPRKRKMRTKVFVTKPDFKK